MIRSKTLPLAFAGALLLLPLAAPPALAGHSDWSIGAGFHVGSAYFQLAFGSSDDRVGHHRPDYYYRTSHRIDRRGHRCSDRCFRDGRFTYHHARCPLLAAHLGHHRVHVPVLFDRFAPPPVWRGHRYDARFDRHRYDRYDRHDRYGDRRDRRHRDRYDRYDPYDRRERDRHHRGRGRGHDKHRDHHSGCRHR